MLSPRREKGGPRTFKILASGIRISQKTNFHEWAVLTGKGVCFWHRKGCVDTSNHALVRKFDIETDLKVKSPGVCLTSPMDEHLFVYCECLIY